MLGEGRVGCFGCEASLLVNHVVVGCPPLVFLELISLINVYLLLNSHFLGENKWKRLFWASESRP